MAKAMQNASKIINDWLAMKSGESLVIITDEACLSQAEILMSAAQTSGAETTLLFIPQEEEHNSTILETAPYAAAIDNSDTIIGATKYSLLTSRKINNATATGHRYLSLPLATNDAAPMLSFDFLAMPPLEAKQMAMLIKDRMHACSTIHVTTPLGSDLTIDVSGRWANFFAGDFSNGDTFDSSCFEVYTAPIETGTNGIMMLDGSFGYIGAPQKPLRIEFRDGRIVNMADTPDGQKLRRYIDAFNDPNMFVAAELGIGLNRFGRCTGNCYIEDESAYGTFHIGMGRNLTLGGKNNAVGHYDLVCFTPTVWADGFVIVKNGTIIEN